MTNDHSPRLIEAKYAIVAVFAIGLIGGAGSWCYYQWLQRRVLQLWGPEAAALMVHAPRAEALWLTRAQSARAGGDEIELDGRRFAVLARVDVSRAPGWIHLRHSLINDGSFDWSAPADDCRPEWDYALRFFDERNDATVLVAFNCQRVKLAGGAREVSLARPRSGKPDDPEKMPPLERFLKNQFRQTQGPSSP